MKKLSIITTVYKKGNIAVAQLNRLVKFVKRNQIHSEIIVVIDGEINNDKELIVNFILRNDLGKLVKVYSYLLNRGKGYAQRYGYTKSTGDVVLFIDADTDIRMKSLDIAFHAYLDNENIVDAIYPSKYNLESDLDGTSNLRKVLSFGLRKLTFLFLGNNKNIDDVSCGLKIFKRSALKLFEKNLFVDRFATDSEIYFWVNRLKLRVISVPFYMNMPKESTSVSIYEILKVLVDLVSIAIKLRFNASLVERRVGYGQIAKPIV